MRLEQMKTGSLHDTVRKRLCFKKRKGNVVDVLTVGILVLGMTVLMIAYLGNIRLMEQKDEIGQIARKYILRMETVGYLTGNDRVQMSQELAGLGIQNLDFTGTTVNQVDYGEPIVLVIRGTIPGQNVIVGGDLLGTVFEKKQYDFEERRMSTAKN